MAASFSRAKLDAIGFGVLARARIAKRERRPDDGSHKRQDHPFKKGNSARCSGSAAMAEEVLGEPRGCARVRMSVTLSYFHLSQSRQARVEAPGIAPPRMNEEM